MEVTVRFRGVDRACLRSYWSSLRVEAAAQEKWEEVDPLLDATSLLCSSLHHHFTMSSAADPQSEGTIRGSEAQEAPEPGQRQRPQGGRGGRVKIARDLGDVPPVRDETGEKVSEMFQGFLEQ